MQADFPKGIAPDSGFLDGHFAGNPIVPGAVLLGLAAEHLALVGLRIEQIHRMKFLRQLEPQTPFEIRLVQGTKHARLEWTSQGTPLAEAKVDVGADNG